MGEHKYKWGDPVEYLQPYEAGWRNGTYVSGDGDPCSPHYVLRGQPGDTTDVACFDNDEIRPMTKPADPTPIDHVHDLPPHVHLAIDAAASCCCNRPEPATCPAPEMGDATPATDLVAVTEVVATYETFARMLNTARVGLLCDPPETKSPLAILTLLEAQIDEVITSLGR